MKKEEPLLFFFMKKLNSKHDFFFPLLKLDFWISGFLCALHLQLPLQVDQCNLHSRDTANYTSQQAKQKLPYSCHSENLAF